MAMPELNGKYVVVTGAGAGIGRATALAFAQAGAHLIVCDLDLARLEHTRAGIAAAGVDCHAFAADVADEASMRQFAAAVHAIVPAVDVLVNNAGVAYLGAFVDSPLASWKRILDINVMGVVHGCHFFLPPMLAAGGARHVLNVASLAGIAPAPNMSAYAASKHAVMGLCDVLAMELDGSAVVVSAVCPGVINTEIVHGPRAPSVTAAQVDKLQAFYRSVGASPDVVAQDIVHAVRRGQSLVLSGPWARPMYHLKRVSRALSRWLTLYDARRNGWI
ncbi:MAG: SDR family NAD(P)-dependent oxidoreductase [Pseudomonadota bacterium]